MPPQKPPAFQTVFGEEREVAKATVGYRRDDTADVAGRIYDALETRFGRDYLFKDVDDIPLGVEIGECNAAVVRRDPDATQGRALRGSLFATPCVERRAAPDIAQLVDGA
jgi:hypothetical protein